MRFGKSGPEKVSITIVKDVKDLIAKPLTGIFNDSVMKGVFPDIWKLAIVTPIFKSGAKMMQTIVGRFLSFGLSPGCWNG